jgi:DNA-binding transcriptional regulator LsrR (DeoR family)
MSTPETAQGPAELVLTASVARRYYIDGRSKVEIAQEFRLSRFKVARLLDSARASGLVRIDIGYPGSIDVGLSGRLQEELGLQPAIVVDTVDDHPASLRSQVGRAAAELLSEIVTADDVLGLGWARSLMAMRASLTSLAPCSVVQLTGALSRPDVDDSSIELVRDVARIAGGPASYFYAPMIVPDATTAAALRRQPEVARAMERFASVTKAVVGVGGWDPPASTVHDALSPSERKALRRLGVLADVSGVFLDEDGTAVEAPLTQRIIGIRAAQLHRVPEVIAIAYGPEKAPATRAAIRGGYVNGLVTHSSFARALLPTG